MPDWLVPLGALCVLVGFLYFAFVQVKLAPRSGKDPDDINPHVH
jgi:hypothetical protein